MLGILAALVYSAAFLHYIYKIVKGNNKPNRSSWLIWSILGFVLLGSYYSVGARETLPLLVVNQIGMISVFLFSIKSGQGGTNKFDLICLSGAGVSLFAWWISNNPLYALLLAILTDLIGALPTIKKSIEQKEGEDNITWALFFIGNLINLIASDITSFSDYIYPLYMSLLCLLISFLLLRHKLLKK